MAFGGVTTLGEVMTIGGVMAFTGVMAFGGVTTLGDVMAFGGVKTFGEVMAFTGVMAFGGVTTLGEVMTIGGVMAFTGVMAFGGVTTLGDVMAFGGVMAFGEVMAFGRVKTFGGVMAFGEVMTIGGVATFRGVITFKRVVQQLLAGCTCYFRRGHDFNGDHPWPLILWYSKSWSILEGMLLLEEMQQLDGLVFNYSQRSCGFLKGWALLLEGSLSELSAHNLTYCSIKSSWPTWTNTILLETLDCCILKNVRAGDWAMNW